MLSAQSQAVTAHDIFSPQPDAYKNPAVFILRSILHDWSDAYATRILKHLRSAAGLETKLVVIDHVLPYSCPSDFGTEESVKGLNTPLPPAPLLANMGGAGSLQYSLDILVGAAAVTLLLTRLIFECRC